MKMTQKLFYFNEYDIKNNNKNDYKRQKILKWNDKFDWNSIK